MPRRWQAGDADRIRLERKEPLSRSVPRLRGTLAAMRQLLNVDGYPVLTRCYKHGTMTLELQLASVSRQPIPDERFEMPRGYKPMDFGMGKRR